MWVRIPPDLLFSGIEERFIQQAHILLRLVRLQLPLGVRQRGVRAYVSWVFLEFIIECIENLSNGTSEHGDKHDATAWAFIDSVKSKRCLASNYTVLK